MENEMDCLIPGGVYLCQVGENVSCGACCGLYNAADASKAALSEMLAQRTEDYAKIPRNMDAVLEFKERVEKRENQDRPYPEFHHCPFVGFVGENGNRVGCLLHPLADGSGGLDFRGLSYYGAMACRQYFCPTHAAVSAMCKRIIRIAASDWYVFGLFVTESEMIENFFSELAKDLKKPLDAKLFHENEAALEPVRTFMRLKLSWPFRKKVGFHPANYFFNDRLYAAPEIGYTALDVAPSKYDAIFRGLKSEFESKEELKEAESIVSGILESLRKIVG